MKNSRQNNWGRSTITNPQRYWYEIVRDRIKHLVTKEHEVQEMAIYIKNIDELNKWISDFAKQLDYSSFNIFVKDEIIKRELEDTIDSISIKEDLE